MDSKILARCPRAFIVSLGRIKQILIAAGVLSISSVALAETEEQRLVRIAQQLKPISDLQWNEIAGTKTSETYDIQKGDTLWDVSKRLFGNSYYWPKVWSLNTDITNPHIVSPGQKLAFTPGSSESMPKLAPDTGESPTTTSSVELQAAPQGSGNKQHEYDKIPADRWAPIDLSSKKSEQNYDEYGLDKELKLVIPSRFVFRVPSIANDTTIPFLGEIIGSRREGVGLSQHETVFLRSNSQDLQVGTTYSVFAEPEFVRERKSDRPGYIYRAIGEVRIVGVKDELYVGIIVNAYDVIKRGARVYPLLPLITEIKPMPSSNALEALAVFSTESSTRNTAQFRFIHLDRGIEDGVQIGNVFRLYDYYDPTSREKLTDSDFLMNADALVVHATAQSSTALVIRSRDTFSRGDSGVLLTDVSDLEKVRGDNTKDFDGPGQGAPEDKELDELDELDRSSGEGLGKKEETEIKELDQWDKTKDLQNDPNAEPTVPSAADSPTDSVEQNPGFDPQSNEPEALPAAPTTPQEPTLDESLESPTITLPGLEMPAPPADLAPEGDQTLDAPPPPPPSEPTDQGMPMEPMEPLGEPMTPDAPPPVEPAQPTPPDDIESPAN